MQELTSLLTTCGVDLDATFRAAVDASTADPRWRPREDLAVLAAVRARHGFAARVAPLLTPPDANLKLDKAAVPSYGLTLQSFRTVLPAVDDAPRHRGRITVNACPNAGHCVKVCVLNNGNGRFDVTQRGRDWKTDLLVRHPDSFVRILATELVAAVRKHGAILYRPNVNSDVAWERVLPSLCNGHIPGITSYGYSKRPETLTGDGWLGSAYRVAYSWNETSRAADVFDFLRRGGSVAVVTSRTPKTSTPGHAFPFGNWAAVDADKTDEWILAGRGVVGDLSAKGKARALIGRSGFVVDAA